MDEWDDKFQNEMNVIDQLNAIENDVYPQEAYAFALEVYHNAPQYFENVPPPPKEVAISYDLDVYNFAHSFILHAKEVFEDPLEKLNSWGIKTSRNIGEVTYGLVGVGLLLESANDDLEKFNDLFKVEELLK